MKRIIVISLIVGFLTGFLFFVFGAKGIFVENMKLAYLQKLSISYANLGTKALYYGQKEYGIFTYADIIAASGLREKISERFPELKIRGLCIDANEDRKMLYIEIMTGCRKIEAPEILQDFVNGHLAGLFTSLTASDMEYIKAEKEALAARIKKTQEDIDKAFKLDIPARYGEMYRNYKLPYGNAPTPGDIQFPDRPGYSVSSLLLDALPRPEKDFRAQFDDVMTSYIYDLHLYNIMIAQSLYLESLENDIGLLNASKLPPVAFIGAEEYRSSGKTLLLRSLIAAAAAMILLFTVLYVIKKD